MNELLTVFVKNLPNHPGVYKFLNKEKEVIYIGKAKNLKNRVSSYFFHYSRQTVKLKKLLEDIQSIEYIVVSTELDALLLENNLIKQLQPRYNVLLKDGKTYPYICITAERFPRIFSTRERDDAKNEYFGPYPNLSLMHTLLGLCKELYKIRSCSLILSKANIENKKFRVCLDYHIKKCNGPCAGLQKEEEYLEQIVQIRQILKGKIGSVKKYIKQKMNEYAKKMKFEQAHIYKNKYNSLHHFQSRSMIVQTKITDVEVYSIKNLEKEAYVNYMKIIDGAIIQSETFSVTKKLYETDEDILIFVVLSLRKKYTDNTKKIVVNTKFFTDIGVEIVCPQRGIFKQFIDLSLKNIHFFILHSQKTKEEFLHKKQTNFKVLKELQKDLQLKDIPIQIDCFDNSNIQGTSPVAAAVCFINGQPAKREYQRFHIKTIEGANDFASMYEIVYRRYKRRLETKSSLPNLIIIDGGKGQLHFASKALKELDIFGNIPIISIAKKLEEIYTPHSSLPLYLNKKSPSLLLIQRIRNEAHRFAIAFHRNERTKKATQSSLTTIKGIGEKTMTQLLIKYKSLERIKKAPKKEVEQLIGRAKTTKLIDFLNHTIQN